MVTPVKIFIKLVFNTHSHHLCYCRRISVILYRTKTVVIFLLNKLSQNTFLKPKFLASRVIKCKAI